MQTDEKIIGYDAREMWEDFNSEWIWSHGRKESMLIRQNIIKPLSTDHEVWPDVFGYRSEQEAWQPDRRLDRSGWMGILDLWEDFQQLYTCLNDGWGTTWKPCWIVAITLRTDGLS